MRQNYFSAPSAIWGRAALLPARFRCLWQLSMPVLALLTGITLFGNAHAEMHALDEGALASVAGRDGISLNLSGFSLSGGARVTYYEPASAGGSVWVQNLNLTRVDDTARAFTDPMTIDVFKGTSGQADYINIAWPQNPAGIASSTWAYDWGVNANGNDWQNGSVVLRNIVQQGSSLQLSTPASGDGVAWALATKLDIANIILRPRGQDDVNVADPSTVAEQLNLTGVHLSAADASGNPLNAPFALGNIATQPGVINALTDSNGDSYLHVGIDWPASGTSAPIGSLRIDNISFKSDKTGNLDLGSSRIGMIQIQQLDIRFHTGP